MFILYFCGGKLGFCIIQISGQRLFAQNKGFCLSTSCVHRTFYLRGLIAAPSLRTPVVEKQLSNYYTF